MGAAWAMVPAHGIGGHVPGKPARVSLRFDQAANYGNLCPGMIVIRRGVDERPAGRDTEIRATLGRATVCRKGRGSASIEDCARAPSPGIRGVHFAGVTAIRSLRAGVELGMEARSDGRTKSP